MSGDELTTLIGAAGGREPIAELHRLEADRLIRSRWDDSTGRRRKWYELTAAGRRRLESHTEQWTRYVECVRAFLPGFRESGELRAES